MLGTRDWQARFEEDWPAPGRGKRRARKEKGTGSGRPAEQGQHVRSGRLGGNVRGKEKSDRGGRTESGSYRAHTERTRCVAAAVAWVYGFFFGPSNGGTGAGGTAGTGLMGPVSELGAGGAVGLEGFGAGAEGGGGAGAGVGAGVGGTGDSSAGLGFASPADGGMSAPASSSGRTTRAMRRFNARPSAVVLGAMG